MFSSIVLQIIAMICMFIDHVGAYLCDDFWLMRMIGRLAMPIFVFGLAQGFIHTSSRLKYFIRIAITAVATQIVLYFLDLHAGYVPNYNILFNFMATFLVLLCAEKGGLLIFLIPVLCGLSEAAHLDYGWVVPAMALGFYLTLRFAKNGSFLYYCGLGATLVLTNVLFFALRGWPIQLYAIAAFVPLAMFNGEKGKRLPKFAGYAFYPAHLALILIIRLLFY